MNIMVDRNFLGYSKAFINERDSHNAFVDDSIVVEGLPNEAHTIGSRPCTTQVKTVDLYFCAPPLSMATSSARPSWSSLTRPMTLTRKQRALASKEERPYADR